MSQFPQAGDIFLNKYVVQNLIGEGAFGRVYRITDMKLERDAALKIIDANHGSMDRFLNEVEGIKKLEHPNVVKLYDYKVLPDGSPCLMMEFVRGRELGDVLFSDGPFSLTRIAQISLQVLDALVETHSFGIVHCDLKPENIILSTVGAREDFVKLLDFGVASILSSENKVDAEKRPLMGTPQYMAPEQIRRTTIGPWTDIYALGLIMIELATGHFTVDDPDIKVILQKQLHEPVQLPIALAKTELGLIISTAVQKDPTQRYQRARDMFNDIQHALAESGHSPQWGKLDDEISSSSRVSHVGARKITSLEEDSALLPVREMYLATQKEAPALETGDFEAGFYQASPSRELESASQLEGLRKSSFSLLLDDVLSRPETGGAVQAKVRAVQAGVGTEQIIENRDQDERPSKEAPQDVENIQSFVQKLDMAPKSKVTGELFVVDGIKPELRAQKIKDVSDKRARRNVRAIAITLGLSVCFIVIGLFVYVQFFHGKQKEPDNLVEANTLGESPRQLVNFRELSLQFLRSANCAAVEGTSVGRDSLQSYKIISTPLDSSVRIGSRRVCVNTPCVVHVIGNVKHMGAQLEYGGKHKVFTLPKVAPGEVETLYPVVE